MTNIRSGKQNTGDTLALRSAFGSFLTGVTIVTTSSAQGSPIGFTANSFTSVSLDPPMLLVSLSNDLNCLNAFASADHFAVNILAADQQNLSNTFASYDGDRFEGIDYAMSKQNSPLLDGVCAWFDCKVHQRLVTGDHTLYIGHIQDFDFREADSLGYSRKGYFSLHHEQLASDLRQMSSQLTTGYLIENNHQLVLKQNGDFLELPQATQRHSLKALHESLERCNIVRDAGTLYSIFQLDQDGHHAIYYRARHNDNDLVLYDSVEAKGKTFVACPIDQLPLNKFESPAVRSMLKRFQYEHSAGSYGIYHGTEKAGEVTLISSGSSLPYSV